MSEYTSEPWVADLYEGGAFNIRQHGEEPIIAGRNEHPSPQESHANARRIVACVNACRGVATETLENVPTLGQIAIEARDKWHTIKDERDELRTRCGEMVKALEEAKTYIRSLPVETECVPGKGFRLESDLVPVMRILEVLNDAIAKAKP